LLLKVLTVYRYRTSGKLIAVGLGNGYVLPLNSDLTFSEKAPHRVRRDTPLDPTPYRLEVETESHAGQTTFRVIRSWNEDHRPPRSENPDAPLEARIDISPSEKFGADAAPRATSPARAGLRTALTRPPDLHILPPLSTK
jgi:hypothetical protein